MPTETTNYGFTKDNEDEFYNVNNVNANLDKIDTEMKRIEDESKSFNQQVIDNTNAIANANTKLDTHIKDDPGHTRYIGSTNATNAWTCSSNLIIWDGTKPKAGVAYRLFAAGANTGAVTLVLSSTNPAITSSTYPVYGMDGKALTAGAVAQGAMVTVCFSGSAFFLQGSGSGVTTRGTQTFSIAGTFNFTVPSGVSKILAYLWGAGGGGGAYNPSSSRGGGGGGGGSFLLSAIDVTPGDQLAIVVGKGGGGSGSTGIDGQSGGTTRITLPTFVSYTAGGGGGGGSASGSISGNGGNGGIYNVTTVAPGGVIDGGKDGVYKPFNPLSLGILLHNFGGGDGARYANSADGGGGGGSASDLSGGLKGVNANGGLYGQVVANHGGAIGGNGGIYSAAAKPGSYPGGGGGGGGFVNNGYSGGANGADGKVVLYW